MNDEPWANAGGSDGELRSLLSAIAKGSEHVPTHRIKLRLSLALEKADQLVLSEGLRALCSQLLDESADADVIAEETYNFWARVTIGMGNATKETRWAFRTERVALQSILVEACRAGSELGCKHARNVASEWNSIIGLRAIRATDPGASPGELSSLEELTSLLSAVVNGSDHAPTHWFPHRLSAALHRHDPSVFSQEVRLLCSSFLSTSVGLDSMAGQTYELCSKVMQGMERSSKEEPFSHWLDRLVLNQILAELCGMGSEAGCDFARDAQHEWAAKIVQPNRGNGD